jgi:quercetin dioxygenase-like cupin family protein
VSLIPGKPWTFNGLIGQDYTCEKAGDELPLHSHQFNHITLCLEGVVECFTSDGNSIPCAPGDPPVEYVAGRRHGIRGLSDGARFLNISPVPA